MHHFHVRNGEMHCEDVPLRRIARDVGTPVYVYSHATLSHHYRVFDEAFGGIPHIVCFSMKSNSNGSVIRTFTGLGSGVDIVSGGELARALAAERVEKIKSAYESRKAEIEKQFDDKLASASAALAFEGKDKVIVIAEE